ncbi:hypothetical protein AVEN_224013-1 [Araneus ventricosus]|uniref:Uncharacterized protein n=1 Tax=Araneus ventricosus TaxID=182803 RepID=A0A4Y2M847_ARAVE|nr:hypothetical protein AVEN_224013-1 [Araneus ventricosus]
MKNRYQLLVLENPNSSEIPDVILKLSENCDIIILQEIMKKYPGTSNTLFRGSIKMSSKTMAKETKQSNSCKTKTKSSCFMNHWLKVPKKLSLKELILTPPQNLSKQRGCGGLVVRSRLWGWRAPGSRPDSTEDPPCMGPVAR